MTGPQVVQVLDQTIDWYRTLGVQQQVSNEPSDLLILHDNRQTANQVVASAFEAARANAEILARQPGPKDTEGASASSQSLSQLQNKFAAKGTEVQNELDSNEARLAAAPPEQKVELQAKISELQGELDLINARKSASGHVVVIHQPKRHEWNQRERIEGADRCNGRHRTFFDGRRFRAVKSRIIQSRIIQSRIIQSRIVQSRRSMPRPTVRRPVRVRLGPTRAVPPSTLTGVSGMAAARFGIWDLAANVVRLSEKAAAIDAVDQHTSALQATFARFRAPLIDQLKQLSARGDTLAAQADTADSATLISVRDQLDALSNQFKQTSALLIPLSKIGVLLDQYRRNIANWHDAIEKQYGDALKTLGVRVGVLAVLLALVFVAGEVWRRAVLRYIYKTRGVDISFYCCAGSRSGASL